jgi:hypothetical protein
MPPAKWRVPLRATLLEGSALMRPTLERCDHEGIPAYLEASSERNAALYERLGFQLTTELRVADSPPLRG